jgi:hypothetical protein
MEHLESRRYEAAEQAAGAYEALCRTIDRLDAHAIVIALRLTEPHPTPVVVLIHDDPQLARRLTTGHWHGGEPVELPAAFRAALLEHAARAVDEADGQTLRRRRQFPQGTRLFEDGTIG